MNTRFDPVITEIDSTQVGRDFEDYTCIRFVPDLDRFGRDSMSEDMVKILTKRVWEIAGCNPQVAVHLQGKRLKIPNMKRCVQCKRWKFYFSLDTPFSKCARYCPALPHHA